MALVLLCLGLIANHLGRTGTLQLQYPERLSHATNPGNAPAASHNPQGRDAHYLNLPLSFEANDGQFAQPVQFVARGGGYSLALSKGDATLCLQRRELAPTANAAGTSTSQPVALRMKLLHARSGARATAEGQLPGKVNYFLGSDPARWRTGISTYQRIRYQEVYPGIDLTYYGSRRQLEYDFVVQPGADPDRIRFEVAGAQTLELNPEGDLVLHAAGGDVVQHAPVVYQEIEGRRQTVEGHYVLTNTNQVGFRIGAYDAQRPLVIDPVLSYSTYLGGSASDGTGGIAVDSTGSAYVAAFTASTNLPTQNPIQAANRGSQDAFIAKLNPAGTALVYATYLGGTGQDYGIGISVDGVGAAYVVGLTDSVDFPMQNPIQPANGGGLDSFVVKLNPAGNGLVYSTYLGSNAVDDHPGGIVVNSAREACVAGWTTGPNFPTRNAVQPAFGGSYDVYVAKLNAAGSALAFSTYLGGTGDDLGRAIAVDAADNIYVTGKTQSLDFPVVNAVQPQIGADQRDAFAAKLTPNGSALFYATYLGGNMNEDATGIAADSAGNAIVVGDTYSTNYPTQNALQATPGGMGDVFVTKLNPGGSALLYSTYLGGTEYDEAYAVAADASGNAYVTGATESPNFPVVSSNQGFGGMADVYITEITPSGNALVYSTFLGGSGYEFALGIAVDSTGSAYVAGNTPSTNFPTVNPLQAANRGGSDSFIAKLGPGAPPPPSATRFSLTAPASVVAGETFSVTLTALDQTNSPFPGYLGTVHFTSTDSQAVLPPDYTFSAADNGVHFFNVVFKTAGAQTLTATDTIKPALKGSTPISVTVASAAKLVFGQQPTNTFVNVAINPPVTVRVVDAFDNLVTSAAHSITLALGNNPGGATLGGTTTLAAVNGVATFSTLTLDKLGNGYTLAPSTGALPGPFPASTPFNVTSRPATHFGVVAPATAISGIPFDVTVTALDAANQPVPTYTGSVHWTSSDPQAVLPSDYTFAAGDNGVRRFSVTLRTVGSRTITVTDKSTPSINGSATVNVSEGGSLVVTTAADTTSGADGVTSLREAMLFANALPGRDTITFKIAGKGVQTISITSALPRVTDPVIVDGYTQPGAKANTLGLGNNAVLLIEVSGALAGTGVNGFTVTAGGSTLRGLVINRFRDVVSGGVASQGSGVHLEGGAGNSIAGCFIGTSTTGTTALPNRGDGITVIADSKNNVLGGDTPAGRNVISGNLVTGVRITGVESTGNTVQGSYLGINAAGVKALPNGTSANLGTGVLIESPGNLIGGVISGARNVISGQPFYGVFASGADATGNLIQGNYLGTNAAGTLAVGNQVGVFIAGASDNRIGGDTPGARNLISGNKLYGIFLDGDSRRNEVQGNYIGTRLTGSTALGNFAGIAIREGTDNTVGGSTPGAGNLISGNATAGISLDNAGGNRIQGNRIGTTLTGTAALPNLIAGVILQAGAKNNLIGGDLPDARNLISGNKGSGIKLLNAGTTGNQVRGNYIGLDATGTKALGNAVSSDDAGVLITSPDNVIGGTSPGARNVISGNTSRGVIIAGGALGTVVQGNYIGTNASGTAAVGNLIGVILGGSGALIGGTSAGTGNLISGNRNAGIGTFIASENVIQGNYVGLDVTGLKALPNAADGIAITAASTNNLIGGTAPGARNVISGNLENGVSIVDATSTGNQVQGNYLGTNAAGLAAVPNTGSGVAVSFGAHDNLIGGLQAGARNVLSGNTKYGILMADLKSGNNVVQGNYIGVDATGMARLSNYDGLHIFSSNNLIGGTAPGAGNVISGSDATALLFTDLAANNVAQGNLVGTNAMGTAAIPNVVGIYSRGTNVGNLIGGTTPGAGNLVSGNVRGVTVLGVNCIVQGNRIGTNLAGTAAIPNTEYGCGVYGDKNRIGGTVAGAGNLISGNQIGLTLVNSHHVVEGNFIGTNLAGTAALPNATYGLSIYGSNNAIGGTAPGAGNLISGNAGYGLLISGKFADGNVVQGNRIGTDVSGTFAVRSVSEVLPRNGIQIEASGNTIGGANPGAGNLVSGNVAAGIHFSGKVSDTQVLGNFIGTDLLGTAPLPNRYGIVVDGGSENAIGGVGPGAGNRIAFNTEQGIYNTTATKLAIRGNSLFNNGKLGIDFPAINATTAGVNPNDALDKDKGANSLQNFPALTAVTVAGGMVTLTGSLNSSAKGRFALDFYRSAAADASGFGEGEVYVGSAAVLTNTLGRATFTVSFPVSAGAAGQYFTATASRDYGSGVFETSEFGQSIQAVP